MSVLYCDTHEHFVDTDVDAEHFEQECEHENTKEQMIEYLRHPDDPVPTTQEYVEVCEDCGIEV